MIHFDTIFLMVYYRIIVIHDVLSHFFIIRLCTCDPRVMCVSVQRLLVFTLTHGRPPKIQTTVEDLSRRVYHLSQFKVRHRMRFQKPPTQDKYQLTGSRVNSRPALTFVCVWLEIFLNSLEQPAAIGTVLICWPLSSLFSPFTKVVAIEKIF